MNEQLHSLQTSLSLAQANAILSECLAVRQREGLLPLAVAVLDAGGQLLTFQREDGCGILRYDIAFGKAWAALGMGMSTRLIRDRLANRPAFQSALASVSDGRFIPVPGGVLILNAQSTVIGSVGVSGDASDRDEYCAIHAIQMAGLGCEPSSHQPEWRNAGL